MNRLWYHQARLLASSIRRAYRKAAKHKKGPLSRGARIYFGQAAVLEDTLRQHLASRS